MDNYEKWKDVLEYANDGSDVDKFAKAMVIESSMYEKPKLKFVELTSNWPYVHDGKTIWFHAGYNFLLHLHDDGEYYWDSSQYGHGNFIPELYYKVKGYSTSNYVFFTDDDKFKIADDFFGYSLPTSLSNDIDKDSMKIVWMAGILDVKGVGSTPWEAMLKCVQKVKNKSKGEI
jgi:hypothetical protein